MCIDFLLLQELLLSPPVTSNAITKAECHMRSAHSLFVFERSKPTLACCPRSGSNVRERQYSPAIMKKQDANSLATGRAESEMFSLSLTPLSVGKAMCAVIGATLPRLVPSSDSLDVIWTPTKVVDVRNAPANSKIRGRR